MSSQNRTIRVFISSTFQDMYEEREALTKYVFPNLRVEFRDINIEIMEIDLRWGITKAQQENGLMLANCFECIDACEPYFIGVLGDRYGYVVDQIPEDILKANQWLREHHGKSITELEVLYGVFHPERVQDLNENAHFFYFKNNGTEDHQNLRILKDQIRNKALLGHVKLTNEYTSLEVFRNQVYKDLANMIISKFGIKEDSNPDDIMEERQRQYVDKESRFYIPSFSHHAKLNSFVDGNERALFVTGDSGIGKSSFLANWIKEVETDLAKRQTNLIYHFVSADFENASAVKIFQHVIQTINGLYNLHYEVQSLKLHDIQRDFFEVLQKVPNDEKVVFVFDGVNQLESNVGSQSFFYQLKLIPSNVKVIVSATTDYKRFAIMNKWGLLPLEELDQESREHLIIQYFKAFQKTIDFDSVKQITSKDITSNPLYLTKLIEELRLHGDTNIKTKIDEYLQSDTARELLERIIKRLDHDYSQVNKDLVESILSLLYVTKYGMRASELAIAVDEKLIPIDWVPFFFHIQTFLIQASGRYVLFHDIFKEAVHHVYLTNKETENKYRRKLVNYYIEQVKTVDNWDSTGSLEVIYQLVKLEDWNLLYELLSDLKFLEVAIKEDDDVVFEAWDILESNSTFKSTDAYEDLIRNSNQYAKDLLWNIAQILLEKGYYTEARRMGYALHPFVTMMKSPQTRTLIHDYSKNIKRLVKGKFNRNNYMQAEQMLISLNNLNMKILSFNGMEFCHNNLGRTYYHLGLEQDTDEGRSFYFTKSHYHFSEQEKLSSLLRNIKPLAACYGNIANVREATGDLQGALEYRKKEEKLLLPQKGLNYFLAYCLIHQAILYRKLGKEDKVTEYMNRVDEELINESKDSIAKFTGRSSKLWKDAGDPDMSISLRLKEEQILRELENYYQIAHCLYDQAQTAYSYKGLPYSSFLKMMEAIIYYKASRRDCSKDLENASQFIRWMSNYYQIPMFTEELYEFNGIHANKWLDADARMIYLHDLMERIEAVTDELQFAPFPFLSSEKVGQKSREELLALYADVKKTEDKHKKVNILREIEFFTKKQKEWAILSKVYQDLTIYLPQIGEKIRLEDVYKDWELCLRKLDDPSLLASCLNDLGDIYMKKGDLHLAFEKLFEQVKIASKSVNYPIYFKGTFTFSWLMTSVKNYEIAILALIKLKDYLQAKGLKERLRRFEKNAEVYRDWFYKKYRSTPNLVPTSEKVFDVFRENPIFEKIGRNLLKAFISEGNKKYEKANEYYEKTLSIYRQNHMEVDVTYIFEKQVEALMISNHYDQAIHKYKELMEEYKKRNSVLNMVEKLENAAVLCRKQKRIEDELYFLLLLKDELRHAGEHLTKLVQILRRLQTIYMELELKNKKTEVEEELEALYEKHPSLRMNKKVDTTVISSIMEEQLEEMESIHSSNDYDYRETLPDAMISMNNLKVVESGLFEKPNSIKIAKYVTDMENGTIFDSVVVTKDHVLLYGIDLFKAAQQIGLSQIPVLYRTKEEVMKHLLDRGMDFKEKNEFAKAIEKVKLQLRMARGWQHQEQLISGIRCLSSIYSKSRNIELALAVFHDFFQFAKEIQMDLDFTSLEGSIIPKGKILLRKYKKLMTHYVDPKDAYTLISKDSIYRKIGKMLEETTYLKAQGDYKEAIQKLDDVLQVYVERNLSHLREEVHQSQVILLHSSKEYELVFQKTVELLQIFREKEVWRRYHGYILGAENYFMEEEQYQKAKIFIELKKEFYVEIQDVGKTNISIHDKLAQIMELDYIKHTVEPSYQTVSVGTIVPPVYSNIHNVDKIRKKKQHYQKYGEFARPIICDQHYQVLDGYASYIAAKELGVIDIEVKIV